MPASTLACESDTFTAQWVAGVRVRPDRTGWRPIARQKDAHAMDATAIIIMLVVGAIAGWLASIVVGGPWGLLGYIVAGLIGGVVGGWLLNALKVPINLWSPIVNSIVTAAIGAIVVILVARLIT
jgi:uncharacterized membrane protein YeaQ/YmgE (transglycosylase-associated protein family)